MGREEKRGEERRREEKREERRREEKRREEKKGDGTGEEYPIPEKKYTSPYKIVSETFQEKNPSSLLTY
jgi:hypothetical protein